MRIACCLLLVAGAVIAADFADVPSDHWAARYVENVTSKGLMDGSPQGLFDGERATTRYEIALVSLRLLNHLKLEKPRGRRTFPDVPADHWAAEAVSVTVQLGIMEPAPSGKFEGQTELTRYELAPVALRLARLYTTAGRVGDPIPFGDVPAGHWARPAIAQLFGAKVLEDNADHLYRGQQTASRYDLAMFASGLVDSGEAAR